MRVPCLVKKKLNPFFSSETGLSHADKNIIQDSGNIFVNNLHNSNDSDNDTISSKYRDICLNFFGGAFFERAFLRGRF